MLRTNTLSLFAITVTFSVYPLTADAQSVMQPGGWEVRVKLTMQDPTTGETKTINESTMKQCLSKAFLDNDPYLTPGIDKEKMAQKGATCSLSDGTRKGNIASWKMACKLSDGTLIDSSISNSASAHAFKSDMRQIVNRDGKAVSMQIAMNSKFIGKCTKDMLQP